MEQRSTPHARGSTSNKEATLSGEGVYPACAGIHPRPRRQLPLSLRLPRMRGDPPEIIGVIAPFRLSTPHARGSTVIRSAVVLKYAVYPACAGIHPIIKR